MAHSKVAHYRKTVQDKGHFFKCKNSVIYTYSTTSPPLLTMPDKDQIVHLLLSVSNTKYSPDYASYPPDYTTSWKEMG